MATCASAWLCRVVDHIAVEVAALEVEAQIAVAPDAPVTPIEQLPDDALLYLLQSRYCPSDKMAERAREIVGRTATRLYPG
jgi:hypothetical protein